MSDDDTTLISNNGLTHFDRAVPDAHFALTTRPTVKQQLVYYSRYADTGAEPLYLRLWYSAQVLIKDWNCDALPDLKTPLDQLDDPRAATVIIWAGQAVLDHMVKLDAIPKA